MKRTLVLSILFVLFILSCRTGRIANQNLSYFYDKSMSPFIPEYRAFHKNDSLTSIFFKINSENLFYVKEGNEESFIAKASIKAELYSSFDMKTFIDSCSIKIQDNDKTNKKDITGSIDIKAKINSSYCLRITFSDINKHSTVDSYLNIYRKSSNSEQNFLMKHPDNSIFYNNRLSSDEEFKIESNNNKIKKLFIRYYNRFFPIATPPFSETMLKAFNFKADSIFTIDIKNGQTQNLKFVKKGIYHFQADTSSKEGFTVFRFDDDFPVVTTIDQMLQPLRYLTSKSEFEDINITKDKKEAIENFWIQTSGNADRAKQMIRLFYNRVKEANQFFTSYIEGWKTDRGIIYIIYGQPNIVYRDKYFEKWIYGEDRNMLSINFVFYKVENPFSDNDYSLNRSPLYKDGWYMAVDNWRR